jgi:hypothetical protein
VAAARAAVEAARHKRGERQLRPSTISEISEELEWGEVDLVAASGRFQGKQHKRGERQLRPSTISEISEELEWGEVDLVAASGRFQGKQHTRRGCTSDATVANRRISGGRDFSSCGRFATPAQSL